MAAMSLLQKSTIGLGLALTHLPLFDLDQGDF